MRWIQSGALGIDGGELARDLVQHASVTSHVGCGTHGETPRIVSTWQRFTSH